MNKQKPHLPWMKWHPSDWRAEPRLKMVSRAARSLWIDMLGLMHESKSYGLLIVGSAALKTGADIARALGDAETEIFHLLDELESSSVFSRQRNGIIYSRRMIRDAKKRDASAKGGRKEGKTTHDNHKGIFSTQGNAQESRGQRPEYVTT